MESVVQVRITARGRAYHGPSCPDGLDHGREISRRFGRTLHPIEWVSLATAVARGKKVCQHCTGE